MLKYNPQEGKWCLQDNCVESTKAEPFGVKFLPDLEVGPSHPRKVQRTREGLAKGDPGRDVRLVGFVLAISWLEHAGQTKWLLNFCRPSF